MGGPSHIDLGLIGAAATMLGCLGPSFLVSTVARRAHRPSQLSWPRKDRPPTMFARLVAQLLWRRASAPQQLR